MLKQREKLMNNSLSSNRINESITEFKDEFHKWAFTRLFFNVKHYPQYKNQIKIQDDEYVRIGYNQILPRNFFIESRGDTYYDHKGIGSNYGKGLAFGETKYIINILDSNIFEEITRKKDEVTSVLSAKFYTYPDVDFGIISNPTIISDFINYDKFKLDYKGSIWGYYGGKPLFWTPEIPQNEVYLVSRKFGTIYIKEDPNMVVQEIHRSEYSKILEDIETLTIIDLPKMVRVKAYEVIHFKVQEELKKSVIKITTEG